MARSTLMDLQFARFRLPCETCVDLRLEDYVERHNLDPEESTQDAADFVLERDDALREEIRTWLAAELSDGRMSMVSHCPPGEEHPFFPVVHRHELLFEMGIHSLWNGDPRAAVAHWHAAYERFLEFWCLAALDLRELDPGTFDTAWKPLARRSETQLGFFLGTHLSLTGEIAPLSAVQKHVELRNRVVHKGYVPTTDEAFRFGQAVADFVIALAVKLRAVDDEKISSLSATHVEWLLAGRPQRTVVRGTHKVPTFLGLRATQYAQWEFAMEEWLSLLASNEWVYGFEHMPLSVEQFDRTREDA